MAVDERTFWSAAAGFDPTGLSINDIKLRAMRQATGLTSGTINDCEHKFYADRLGIEGSGFSIADLKRRYFALIGVDLNVVRRNLNPNPSFESGALSPWAASSLTASISNVWAKSGTSSCLATSTGSGDVRVGGYGSGLPLGMLPGHTYTLSACIYTPAPHITFVNSDTSRQRRLMFFYSNDGATTTAQIFGPQGPNIAGEAIISNTFTVPLTAKGAILAVACSGSASDTNFQTYIDNLMLEESNTLNPYFDGSLSPDPALTPQWLSSPNNSQSVLINNTFQSALSDMQKRYIAGTLNPDWSWTAA